LSIDHHGSYGSHLIDSREGLRVGNSSFAHNAKVGLNLLKSRDVVVSGNHFEGGQHGVRCADSQNLALTGNVFARQAGAAVKAEARCAHIAVVGNVAAGPAGSGSEGGPAFDLGGASDAIVGQNAVGK
jgi:nitrous oxidase accessory protein NosD